MEYRLMTIGTYPQEMSLPTFEGELLSDVIRRARINGVGLDSTNVPVFDPEDVDMVDPESDIRTDYFALAEFDENQRSAAASMTDRAGSAAASAEAVSEVSNPAEVVDAVETAE